MRVVEMINFIIMILFFICYSYQFFYIPVVWLKKPKAHKKVALHRFAVLIAARNEQSVIGNLIDSLKEQDYPEEYLDIYVVADNCTDQTAEVARNHGAAVFERNNKAQVGKGYALNFLLKKIHETSTRFYDGYFVFDADNVLCPDFVSNMNQTFSDGYKIVTCYRNSKNYGDNWISAGYALWFLRESRYLNGARMLLGSSCAVSGTGFLFSDSILQKHQGWNFFLLTEDIEFTIANIVDGEKVGYCADAMLYDEQPVTFRQSWRQRMRWSRGYMQVTGRYGWRLIKGIFHGSFSCYDMTMNIMPAALLTGLGAVVNIGAAIANFIALGAWTELGVSVLQTLINLYLLMFVIGGITTVTEWRNIHTTSIKKILYMFTFPVFMFTYLPIYIAALFKNPQWAPIQHSRNMKLADIQAKG